MTERQGAGTVESFTGKLAVVTGGATGIGRALVVRLAAAGCSVATCDVNEGALAETKRLAEAGAPARANGSGGPAVRVTTHRCDVSDEAQVERFRDEVVERHARDHVHLLVNNAGITGGGSFLKADRAEWDRVFGVNWSGVYHCSRAFVPLLVASDGATLVNVSSVNGFWAWLGPNVPHTAYSASKFAVKGFTEALIEDFRLNAPHVRAAVVMPGHVGTDIALNAWRAKGKDGPAMDAEDLAEMRESVGRLGIDVAGLSDADLEAMAALGGERYREDAPVSADEAARVILDGVAAGEWRILIGEDAARLDERVRRDPASVYDVPPHA
jgi:NAD(P)-dependent dehydrogenase (short-subunit alcohol dehydrogenase family)